MGLTEKSQEGKVIQEGAAAEKSQEGAAAETGERSAAGNFESSLSFPQHAADQKLSSVRREPDCPTGKLVHGYLYPSGIFSCSSGK